MREPRRLLEESSAATPATAFDVAAVEQEGQIIGGLCPISRGRRLKRANRVLVQRLSQVEARFFWQVAQTV
jgi:hypothetical protein